MTDAISTAQKLRECDRCKLQTEPLGGVEVRTKWHCAKCWVKLMQKGAR